MHLFIFLIGPYNNKGSLKKKKINQCGNCCQVVVGFPLAPSDNTTIRL